MLFNSMSFLVFFPLVLLLYFIIPKKGRYLWLLAASYYFYMCWNVEYALLLFVSTLITYGAARGIALAENHMGWKKGLVGASLVCNMGILFLFKYYGFVWDTMETLLGKAGISFQAPVLNLLLPVGISFYIFQAVGYTVDIYRGKLEPEKNFFRYALFVSFFPQLVAGPIERSTNLLPQLQKLHEIHLWNPKRIQQGALVMLYGYFLKMVLADRAAIYVDAIFDPITYTNNQGLVVLIGAILFALQIYCDFAGYTYIAIGAAKIMGIELMHNFQAPYLSCSIKEFWSKWHISLTSWFRDYLYIPLGGNRKGNIRKYFNVFVVFLVSGLWHGASWHYVIWGAVHGILRVVEEATSGIWGQAKTFADKLLRCVITFFLVTFAWIFFRAESVGQAVALMKSVFAKWNPWVLTDGTLNAFGLDEKDWLVLGVSILVLLLVDCCRKKKVALSQWFIQQNLWFRWLFFYAGILAVVLLGIYGPSYNAAQFIYFQF